MKLAVFGKTPANKQKLKRAVIAAGFSYDEKKPDIVISYGGDGTFLYSERTYPGTPKALFRASKLCHQCHNLPIEHALELLKRKKYSTTTLQKLTVRARGKTLLAVNDIVVRNINPLHAIRFTLEINGKKMPHEYIGDGLVVATPFGSSGYFSSITRKTFTSGVGLAFNNTTIRHAPILHKTLRVKLTLTRGSAHVCADNNSRIIILDAGKSVSISLSRKKTTLIRF